MQPKTGNQIFPSALEQGRSEFAEVMPVAKDERLVLHIPETLNDGRLVCNDQLQGYEDELLNIAGGFTLVYGIGAWRSPQEHCYREPIRLYEVDVPNDRARTRLLALASRIALELMQEAVYVTSSGVRGRLVTAAGAISEYAEFVVVSHTNGKEADVY